MFNTHPVDDDQLCEARVEIDGETVLCDYAATIRVAGEQDSFGTEWLYFCAACWVTERREWLAAEEVENERRRVGSCRICGQRSTELCPTTLFNSNSWEGPLYVCPPCTSKEYDEITKYLDGIRRD